MFNDYEDLLPHTKHIYAFKEQILTVLPRTSGLHCYHITFIMVNGLQSQAYCGQYYQAQRLSFLVVL
jgi:hypothetical protein